MKLAFAVLALLCLSSAAQASQQKLPLSGLLVNKDVNVSLTDLLPQVNISDIAAMIHALPKFQMPVVNITGLGAFHKGNGSDIQIPLVSLLGLKSGAKAMPLQHLLSALNGTVGVHKNFSMPSLPSVNVSSVAVPLHALLGAGKAIKALPLQHLLSLVNATHSVSLNLPKLNVSDVGVPLASLLHTKIQGLPLLAHLAGGNATLSLPVVNIPKPSISVTTSNASSISLHELLGLKAMPLAQLATKGASLLASLHNGTDINLLAGLHKSFNMSELPLGSLAALHKGFNISGLPLSALVDGKLGALAGLFNGTASGPSVGINVVPGSIGMKNVALNLTHPTLGLKPLALALNLTTPELAMKLAALNLTLPIPSVGMGSKSINLTLPVPELGASMGNMTIQIPTVHPTMPSISVNSNGTDGNSTSKSITVTKPGLSVGSANITLPTITPQLALKLAQLGINVPTPTLGMKKATIGATVPMPDVQLAQKAVNLTLPVPDVGFKQVGLNLTVPDIQLPRLELNVTGMPKVHLG